MRKTFTRYVLLLAALVLCNGAKAQDGSDRKINGNGTEQPFAETTAPRNFTHHTDHSKYTDLGEKLYTDTSWSNLLLVRESRP
jgi:hypothetical protein